MQKFNTFAEAARALEKAHKAEKYAKKLAYANKKRNK